MPDDVQFQTTTPATPPASLKVATDQLPDGADAQLIGLLGGPADTPRAAGRIAGDATFGLDVDVTRSVLPSGAATEATLDARTGGLTETAPATDTASSGLNGRLQRMAQRITSLIALLPTSIGQKAKAGSLSITLASDHDAVPISGTVTATGGLTDAEMRATAVPVSGTVTASGPVTDTQLRATPVPVSGTVTATTGGLTDTQLRASAVPVSGPLTDAQLRATPVPVSGSLTVTGGLTDTELRASAVPVSGPLTDAQLRAAAVPISAASLPLPTSAATETTLAALNTKVPSSPAAEHTTAASPHAARLSDGAAFYKATTPSDTQPVSAASLPLPSGASTEATLDARTGALTETAPATDTASSGLNGRLQRIAQRITSLIALLPTSLGQKTMANGLAVTVASDQSAIPASQSGTWTVQPGNTANTTAWKVDGSAATQPVSGTVSVSGVAQDATVGTTNTELGGLTETAPGTDTASSGLNGRLQRIAQRLTSLIALLPTALGSGGGLKVDGSGTALPVSGTVTANIGTTGTLALDATLGTTNTDLGGVTESAPATDTASSGLNGRLQRIAQRLTSLIALLPTALGQGTMAQSLPVVLPSNQTNVPVGGSMVMVQTSKTRPADTAAYAANDAIDVSTSAPTGWTFTNVARVAGGSGTIVGVRLETDQVANVSAYRLYLYNAAPSAINDNAECTYLIANKASYVGYIDFPALVKDSTNTTAAKSEYDGGIKNFVCAADRNLYGLLRTTTGFTPASAQVFTVSLVVAQD